MSPKTFSCIAVLGSGTMGSGIALAALRSGLQTVLYDIDETSLSRATAYISKHLERKGQTALLDNLQTTSELAASKNAEVVIEAAPERMQLKQALFAELENHLSDNAILASNTSTLSITELASATGCAQRIAGMHFFNPAPVMPLVELIRGARTSDETIARLQLLAQQLGKTAVIASDTPGFIVNRVARPFYGEALRLLQENAADHETIDRIIRGAGFRMGPFQLMDLIGIDINFTVMSSMYEQMYQEARYKPSLVQLQKIRDNALGKKSGRGFYDYENEQDEAPQAGSAPAFTKALCVVPGYWNTEIEQHFIRAGVQVIPDAEHAGALVLTTGRKENITDVLRAADASLAPEYPLIVQCHDSTLMHLSSLCKHPRRLIGFDALSLGLSPVVTLVKNEFTDETALQTAISLFTSMGKTPALISDTPALVLPRLLAMLANEAAFAVLEGVADGDTIDTAMKLGVNYPKGPLEWARNLGFGRMLDILEHLYAEYREERYRPCFMLRQWARREKSGL